jgi:hypothetical protein
VHRERGERVRKTSRLVLRFGLVFVVCLSALAPLWPRIAPAYTNVVAALSRPLFRLVENPSVTTVDPRGDQVWILREVAEGEAAPFTWFDRYTFFAVVALIALFAATPGLGFRYRAVRTAVGLAMLLGIHVVYVVASVELAYSAVIHGRALDGWQVLVRVLWEAAPVLVWVLLTAGIWRRRLRVLRAKGRNERPAMEPVRAEG